MDSGGGGAGRGVPMDIGAIRGQLFRNCFVCSSGKTDTVEFNTSLTPKSQRRRRRGGGGGGGEGGGGRGGRGGAK